MQCLFYEVEIGSSKQHLDVELEDLTAVSIVWE
jgi:hypothetical protein